MVKTVVICASIILFIFLSSVACLLCHLLTPSAWAWTVLVTVPFIHLTTSWNHAVFFSYIYDIPNVSSRILDSWTKKSSEISLFFLLRMCNSWNHVHCKFFRIYFNWKLVFCPLDVDRDLISQREKGEEITKSHAPEPTSPRSHGQSCVFLFLLSLPFNPREGKRRTVERFLQRWLGLCSCGLRWTMFETREDFFIPRWPSCPTVSSRTFYKPVCSRRDLESLDHSRLTLVLPVIW